MNNEASIRAGIANYAKRRLPPEQARVAIQIALEHYFPYRTHHGRHAVDLLEATVSGVLDAWLSKPLKTYRRTTCTKLPELSLYGEAWL